MTPTIFGILACLVYLASMGTQIASFRRPIQARHTVVCLTGGIAVVLHGLFSLQLIATDAGINLGIAPMASLITLIISAIVVISSLRRPIDNLVIGIFPLAMLAIIVGLTLEETYTPRRDLGAGIISHIVLSVVAYGLLGIAALQAILLSFGDYELKNRKFSLVRHLPPLQTMEALLFELLWTGLIFLTLSIASGFIFLGDIQSPGLIHHTVITLIAWAVFAVLLWGRHQLGWRGATASRWTLSGFGLLLLGYFGSKLVLEIILGGS